MTETASTGVTLTTEAMNAKPTPYCCVMGCEKEAKKLVIHDSTPDGFTHACGDEHAKALIPVDYSCFIIVDLH